jgi:hypothetical protein
MRVGKSKATEVGRVLLPERRVEVGRVGDQPRPHVPRGTHVREDADEDDEIVQREYPQDAPAVELANHQKAVRRRRLRVVAALDQDPCDEKPAQDEEEPYA